VDCGLDEAGRGAAIGPLVVACVCAPLGSLAELGVRDSKLLTPRRREALFGKIEKRATVRVREIWPEELNALMEEKSLNEIELEAMAGLIRKCGCVRAFVDAVSPDEAEFARRLREATGVEVIARHRAESLFDLVAAASIVAKVVRDRRIRKIASEIGDFGSGYPSDPRTREFLRKYVEERGSLPPYVRKKWKNVKRLLAGCELESFAIREGEAGGGKEDPGREA